MDASILVVGNDSFRSTLLNAICGLANFTVEVAPNPHEAIPLVQAQQPDLLLIQAEQDGSSELCQQVKAQSRLAWIYCILLNESWFDGAYASKQAILQAEALELGADAYLCLNLEEVRSGQTSLFRRLLQAQVQAGLRLVQTHRELMRANDLLSAIALSDPLTELNNRRAFEWELPRQIQNARTRNVPISLVMLDVDYFKVINDTHGHLVGDRALQLVAARLRHNLRFYDTPFRYGGEEFVVILSDTDAHEAYITACRLCQLMSDQPFAISNDLDLRITISAGTATLHPDDDPKGTSLLHRADQRLLLAKSQGRNRVVSCLDPFDSPAALP